MSPQLIITLSVTVSVACALLGVYYFWRDGKSPTFAERLTVVVDRESKGARPVRVTATGKATGLFDVIVPRLSGGLQPRTRLEQQKLKLKMARAGFNGNHVA